MTTTSSWTTNMNERKKIKTCLTRTSKQYQTRARTLMPRQIYIAHYRTIKLWGRFQKPVIAGKEYRTVCFVIPKPSAINSWFESKLAQNPSTHTHSLIRTHTQTLLLTHSPKKPNDVRNYFILKEQRSTMRERQRWREFCDGTGNGERQFAELNGCSRRVDECKCDSESVVWVIYIWIYDS